MQGEFVAAREHLHVESDRLRRDLHSFPTRRSSDLFSSITMTSLLAVESTIFSRSSAAPPPSTWSDRKSTRLNSSHVSISYAVFCLKKKMALSYRAEWGLHWVALRTVPAVLSATRRE